MNINRRTFLARTSAVATGFTGLEKLLAADASPDVIDSPYGPLLPDPREIIELPGGFSYKVLSRTGHRMSDGYKVPGQPDGMGCFALDDERLCLVRNHEIGHTHFAVGPFEDNKTLPDSIDPAMSFDPGRFGGQPFVGGTTNLVFNTRTGKMEKQFLSLTGTDRNCAGGITPWNSWITSEEPGDLTSKWGIAHGYNFEVPAGATPQLTRPVPLKAMGRFRHEAVAVDPESGIVYQTEDKSDSAIYRFIPTQKGKLAAGGKLQALKITDKPGCDTRNQKDDKEVFPLGTRIAVEWIDLDEVESPKDDLRHRAVQKGAAIFSRGEGMWYGDADAVGEGSVYWACTDGGKNRTGQIFRYFPGPSGGELELYLEPNNSELLKKGDNITIAPSGHLYICEDAGGTNFIRGVTSEGKIFSFAKNVEIFRDTRGASEFAGACFSPDGKTLFVNTQTPGATLAITGPFVG